MKKANVGACTLQLGDRVFWMLDKSSHKIRIVGRTQGYVEAAQHFTAQVTQPLNSLQNSPAIHFHPRWKDGLRRP